MPAAFGGFFLLIFILPFAFGIITMIMRMNTARNLARRSGMDPDAASAVSMLSSNGLDAAYLAANLRNGGAAQAPAPGVAEPHKSAAARLDELQDLRTRGLITDAEYATRRQQIISEV